MNNYKHLTYDERSHIGYLRRKRFSLRKIAQELNRNVSTISRELRRNTCPNGRYMAYHAENYSRARRRRERRGMKMDTQIWQESCKLLAKKFSPKQISGRLKLENKPYVSHETLYKYIWLDKKRGGDLHKDLRQSSKLRRKRHNSKDSRGRLAGKRMIDTRPKSIEQRDEVGHWEIDTVFGKGKKCIVTLVERATGYVMIGQINSRQVDDLNYRVGKLIKRIPELFKTITADNGCEFHGYKFLERTCGIKFYFAFPYHSWERGTNENTNGLIRQYLPKGTSMENLSQVDCNKIARELNNRPRERYGYKTPAEMLAEKANVALNA